MSLAAHTAAQSFANVIAMDAFRGSAHVRRPAPADGHVAEIVTRLLERVGSNLSTEQAAAKDTIAQAVALIRAEREEDAATHRLSTEVARGGLAPWQARRVIAFIGDQIAASIQIEELAKVAKLSKSYFSRAFRSTFGQSPHAYIIGQRILRAKELMLTTGAPLAEIALDCGFADQAHLSRLFRQMVGSSPSAWRRGRVAN
jgi:AraC family transcriptional regulator